MARYIAVVEHELEAFGAYIPDCPGCTAMGRDEDEAVTNVTEALREWMADRIADGMAPPRPSSIEQVRAGRAAAGEADTASLLALVPLLVDEGRLVRANISLDANFLKTIDAEARLRGLTRSAFLASAAREKIAAGR